MNLNVESAGFQQVHLFGSQIDCSCDCALRGLCHGEIGNDWTSGTHGRARAELSDRGRIFESVEGPGNGQLGAIECRCYVRGGKDAGAFIDIGSSRRTLQRDNAELRLVGLRRLRRQARCDDHRRYEQKRPIRLHRCAPNCRNVRGKLCPKGHVDAPTLSAVVGVAGEQP